MITPEYRATIKKIFYRYKKLLKIPNSWHVRISVDDKLNAFGEVTYVYETKKFHIVINPKRNKKIDELEDSILHELLHILFTPASTRLDKLLTRIQLHEKINIKRVMKNLALHEERLVVNLAKIIGSQKKESNDKK